MRTFYHDLDPDDDVDEESCDPDEDRDYDEFISEVVSGERPPRNHSEEIALSMWRERHAK